MHQAFRALQYVNIAAYIALAGVALLTWRRRRDRTAAWAAAAFGALGLLEILGFIPNHPGNLAERAVGRVELARVEHQAHRRQAAAAAGRTHGGQVADSQLGHGVFSPGADILDLALAGKTATVEGIEQDFEGRVYLAVTVDDDPGKDLGALRQPGHRFFFQPEEVEPL